MSASTKVFIPISKEAMMQSILTRLYKMNEPKKNTLSFYEIMFAIVPEDNPMLLSISTALDIFQELIDLNYIWVETEESTYYKVNTKKIEKEITAI